MHSKSYESRSAASVALSQIFTLVPVWAPASHHDKSMESDPNPVITHIDFPKFSVQNLIMQSNLLLASSGKEFAKPAGLLSTPQEVKKARKEAMGRLGLGFLDSVEDDMDLEKEFAAEMDVDLPEDSTVAGTPIEATASTSMDVCTADIPPIKAASPSTRSASPTAVPSPSDQEPPQEVDTAQMSARERNRLKRKRKPGNSAFVAPPPQAPGSKYATAPSGTSNKCVSVVRHGHIRQLTSF